MMSTPRSGGPSSQASNIPDNTLLVCSVQSSLNLQKLRSRRYSKKLVVGTMSMQNDIEIKATIRRHRDGDIMLKIDPKIPYRYPNVKLLTTPYHMLINIQEIKEDSTDILSEEIARQFTLQEPSTTLDYKLLAKEWLEQSNCSNIDVSIKVIYKKLHIEESLDFLMITSAAGW